MERKIFLTNCKRIFKENGFMVKGTTHFYKDLSNDIMLVIAMTHSSYDSVYYFDGGFVIKCLNQYMPYPKYYDVNVRCATIKVAGQYAFNYLEMTDSDFSVLNEAIQQKIDFLCNCDDKKRILDNIILPNAYAYCKDYNTQDYFDGCIPECKLHPEVNQQ